MSGSAGSGYFISPDSGPGPGVLLLHSLWGLNRQAKDTANRLADHGFTVLAPDLNAGAVFDDTAEALAALHEADMNVTASLVQSSVGILRRASNDKTAPIGVVGYGPGASWGLWVSARLTEEISAVVTYYGAQSISMERAQASYLCHWAETDILVSDLEVADLGLNMQMADLDFRFEHHESTSSGFAERGLQEFNAEAEAVAWRQTAEFLAENLRQRVDDDDDEEE